MSVVPAGANGTITRTGRDGIGLCRRDARQSWQRDSSGCQMQKSSTGKFHSITHEQLIRDDHANRLGGLPVDDKLELGRLQDRQISRLGALEDATCIDASLAKRVGNAGSVAHQPASFGIVTHRIGRGNRVARCQSGKLDAPAVEERVGRDEQGFCPVARDSGEGRLNLPVGAGVEDLNLQSQSACSFRYVS